MILRGTLYSRALEMDTGLTVILPRRRESGLPCRTVYLLHGLCGNSGDWADFTMLPLFAKDYHAAFVMPEVSRSFYTDMKYGQKFFTYVSQELPEICGDVFRVSAAPEDRAVMGASMGGYGALKTALTFPDRFGFCAVFSAACLYLKELFDEHRAHRHEPEFQEKYGAQLPVDFAAAFGEELQWKPELELLHLARLVSPSQRPPVYSACGDEDPFLKLNRRFAGDMGRLDWDFTYEEPPGRHDWYFFNGALHRALQFWLG